MPTLKAFIIPQSLLPNRGAHRRGESLAKFVPTFGGGRAGHWSPARRRERVPFASPSGDSGDSEARADGDGVYRVNLRDLEGASRRSLLVAFTCNACGGRSERLVNPLAWAKGMVIAQCEQCKAWHKIADSQGMVEEYRFDNSDDE